MAHVMKRRMAVWSPGYFICAKTHRSACRTRGSERREGMGPNLTLPPGDPSSLSMTNWALARDGVTPALLGRRRLVVGREECTDLAPERIRLVAVVTIGAKCSFPVGDRNGDCHVLRRQVGEGR